MRNLSFVSKLLIGILSFLMVVTIAMVYYSYVNFSHNYKKMMANQLKSVANLVADDLMVWRNERLADALYVQTNREFHRYVDSYLKAPSDTVAANRLLSFVKQLQANHHYDFFLLSKTGKVDFVEDKNKFPISSMVSTKAAECIASKKVMLLDFYQNEYNENIFLSLLIPLNIEGFGSSLEEVAVFRIYPSDYIYPTLANWPVPLQTAEILLMRQQGDSMFFLNKNRIIQDDTIALSLPIVDSIDVKKPAFYLGEGIWHMQGSAGVEYVAYSKIVDKSPWVLVTRIEKHVAYKILRERSIILLITVAIFILAVILVLILIIHGQKLNWYRRKFDAERKLRKTEDLYSTLIRSVPQKIFFKNKNLVYESCNELVAADLGLAPEAIVGKTDFDLHGELLAKKYQADDRRILLTGVAEHIEEDYEVNGEIRTILITKTPIRDDSDTPAGILGVYTDITERKKSELLLKKANRLYNVLSEVNLAIVRISNIHALYQKVCDIGVNVGEYRNIWIGIYDESKNALVEVAKAGVFEKPIMPCLSSLHLKTCPVTKAFNEGKYQIGGKDKSVGCSLDICEYGIRSLAYFPIIVKDKTIGILGVYVGVDNFFSAEELKLLEELTSNIAFATEVDAMEQARLQIEASIKVQKERLEMAQRIGRVGSWEYDPQSKIMWASDESFRIYGIAITPDSCVTLEAILDCLSDRDSIQLALQNLIQHNEAFDMQFEVVPPNGEPNRWVHIIAQLNNDMEDKAVRVVGVIEDITEQHGFQVALEQSEEYFRLLYQQAPAPYQSLNEKGDIVEVNKAWLDRLGYEKEEVVGHNFAEFLVPEQVPLFQERFPKFKEQGVISGIDFNLLHKNGNTVIILEVDGRIAYEQEGRFKQTHCVLHDITEKKEAEIALREREARYKLLFDSNPMPMLVFELETLSIMAVNEAIIQKYGYSHAELLSMTLEDIRPKEDAQFLFQKMEELYDGKITMHPARHILKDGTIILVELISHPIVYFDRPARLVSINDTTEKILAENAVRESKELAQSTLDSLSALIVVLNKKAEVLTINRSWEDQLNANHAILQSAHLGQDFVENCLTSKAVGMDSAYSFADGVKSVLSGEARSFSLIFEVEGRRGTQWYLGKVFPINTTNSSKAKVVVICENITRRKQYENTLRNSEQKLIQQNEAFSILNEELTESNERIKSINEELLTAKEKAEESDRLKSAFLANMSHEIRTPMNGLLGFSEMLGIPNLSDEKRAFYMDIVKKTSQQLLSIINDIIDISKIETNQVKVNLGNTNLSALMNKVKAVLDPQATLKQLELRLAMDVPDDYCNVVTDEVKLTQVITNLINNALKFTLKGYIEFGVSKEDDLLKFYVKDTGIGITPENQLLVFERFRQVETDLTRHFGGSGLGLSISKAFVEVLGGRIWLESEFGKGSTFFFTIPFFSSDTASLGSQPSTRYSKDNLLGVVILVAEDEDVNFLYLNELMHETGVTIIRAKNGQEAVDIGTADSRISLVLMDIKMPIMSGDEATKQLKAVRPHLPIIATTAYAMGGDKDRLLKVGCDAYLSKPIGQKELFELIRNFLQR